MSDIKPIYSGEAIFRAVVESDSSGRWIRLELESGEGAHPFKGLKGERFGVVIVGPLASAEHTNLGLGEDASGERPAQPRVKGAAEGTGAMRADPSSPKPKRRWQDMPASQRAALRVKEPSFWAFLTEFTQAAVDNENTADGYVKAYCGVASKAELTDTAAKHFEELESRYVAFQQARGHGVI